MLLHMAHQVRIFLHHSSVPFQAAAAEATKGPYATAQVGAPRVVTGPSFSLGVLFGGF